MVASMTHRGLANSFLAGAAAAALALVGPSCDCGGGVLGDDGGWDGGDGGGEPDANPPGPTTQVLEHHGGPSRSGLFVDPGMTRASVGDGGLRRDTSFAPAVAGQVYAQPLYFENAGGPDLVVVATEQNNVYALNAEDGGVVWRRALPQAMTSSQLPCGNISPWHGITGTPVIDPQARALYLSALIGADAGTGVPAARHQVYGLSLDDGSTLPGWPVDMNASARSGAVAFTSPVQGQRSALSLLGGTLYVPYGGLAGDCGNYRGWVVGLPTANPSAVQAWATRAVKSGIWAVGGLSSDGTSLYGATGNAAGGSSYGDQESVLRFGPGPTFSQLDQDRWTPSNWSLLDDLDADLSGSGPALVDLPGSSPSALVVQLGKDGNAYLLDRASLGGQGGQLSQLRIASNAIIQAAAVYRTATATYLAVAATGTGCPSGSGDLIAVRVNPGSPPTLSMAWCAQQRGRSSPIVTTTDGRSEAMVWTVGTSDGRLRAFDGDTGELLFTSTDTMTGLHPFLAPIFAKGRIFIAADNRVYAYTR